MFRAVSDFRSSEVLKSLCQYCDCMGSHRKSYDDVFDDQYTARGRKACRACQDFTSWVKKNSNKKVGNRKITYFSSVSDVRFDLRSNNA